MKKFLNHFFRKRKIVLVRKKVVLTIVLAVFFIEAFVFFNISQVIPYERFLASIISGLLTDLTNEERSSFNLGQLTVNPLLEEAATLKAQDMAKKSYFAHTSPEGTTPWHWFEEVGYNFSYAGENLAVNFIDTNVLHRAWLGSAKHRDNILNERFTEIGIGTAEGTYKGRNAIFVVQLFGRPRLSPPIVREVLALEEQEPELITTEPEPMVEETREPVPEPFAPVLGEERESFVAVKNIEEEEEELDLFLAGEQEEKRYSSFMARTLSSPKTAFNIILMSLAGFLVGFGIFGVFNKKQGMNFYSLAINMIIVLSVIGGSAYVNHWVFSIFGSIL